jgi:Protein of unknown function (DUF3365)
MTRRPSFLVIFGIAAFGMAIASTVHSEEKAHKLSSVSIRKMADSLHTVIAADRQAYAQLIVQRLHDDEKLVKATEYWREAHGLPVPEQLLKAAAQNIQTAGAEFSYVLRSTWAINPNNGPQTQVEQTGIEQVTKNPKEAFYAEEELGGRSYFTAIYADRATLSSCVDCHNQHPRSPRKDFKLGDVMGALVIRVPLEF